MTPEDRRKVAAEIQDLFQSIPSTEPRGGRMRHVPRQIQGDDGKAGVVRPCGCSQGNGRRTGRHGGSRDGRQGALGGDRCGFQQAQGPPVQARGTWEE